MPRNIARRVTTVVACSGAILCYSFVARAQTVDPVFNPSADQVVWSMAVQPDGKIIVGGEFTHLGYGTGVVGHAHAHRYPRVLSCGANVRAQCELVSSQQVDAHPIESW